MINIYMINISHIETYIHNIYVHVIQTIKSLYQGEEKQEWRQDKVGRQANEQVKKETRRLMEWNSVQGQEIYLPIYR